jgi:hypothetical protein
MHVEVRKLSHVFYANGAGAAPTCPIPSTSSFSPRDFPFLTCLERKNSFGAGGDKRSLCLPSVGEVGRKLVFRYFVEAVEAEGPLFLKFVGWDFGYCGNYWPTIPAPDDR